MSVRAKLALWLAALFGGALATLGAIGVLLASGLAAGDRQVLLRVLSERAPLLVFAALILLAICYGVVRWLFSEYVTAARALGEQAQIALEVNDGLLLESEGAREIAALATVINRLVAEKRRLRGEVELRAQEQRQRLEEERNRLAALMSELTEGVLVCNAEGRILLYNEQARALFAAAQTSAQAPPVGLGRSVFSLIDREQLAHAFEKLEQNLGRGERAPSTRFVTATAAGRLLKIEAAPYGGARGRVAGLVLTLSDVTGLLERETQHLSLLQALAAGTRAPVANLRAAAENLAAFPDMEPEQRRRFVEIVAAESRGLSRSIDGALRAYGQALKASITLEDMRAVDVIRVAGRRLEAGAGVTVATDATEEGIWLRVDSFALVQALAFLAGRLQEDHGVRSVRLSARAAGRFAELDLSWSGAPVAAEALAAWEGEPMRVGTEHTPLTLRDVLERHGAELWLQHEGVHADRSPCFRFLLPVGEPAPAGARSVAAGSRPEYYDFDLFARAGSSGELQERPLDELSYTVFDTETTGLEPSAGDEIISIAAVRLVNGRLLKNEVFERLIDPRRPVNPEAVRVHGIEASALAGQPTIDEVLPAFHRFCEDTVLVAHNAAFDMRFLELKEATTGVRFTQPVLDTLLLSAVVHPSLTDHRLESIAERLGVRVIGRHTALGDALVEGEVFLKLIALLAERGIVTLRQAIDASRETYYARLQY